VAVSGDWTTKLFTRSLLKQHRQLWVSACNPSTTDHSIKVISNAYTHTPGTTQDSDQDNDISDIILAVKTTLST
jgi:hypothetical protein